ncbi:MAG: succinate dehydrogenase cytochrome b558 subunit [Planctomycetes bacterium]|nr:succinate dehydrogenase cytochrome b558 subunit [Planctomycetota bacterium]
MAGQAASAQPEFWEKHHFWIRRIHSLMGVVPLGVFLVMHLMTNASILGGAEVFNGAVERLHSLGPLLVPVEIVGIFIPLTFHILIGIKIVTTAKNNAGIYKYRANIRYTLQRTSGVIATLFIIYHLFHMHWIGRPLSFMGGAQFDPHNATETAAAAIQLHWIIAPIYAAGVISTVYHFANGLWTFLITWGITVGQRAQRVAGGMCAALGVMLCIVGLAAVSGFRMYDVGEHRDAPDAHAMSVQEESVAGGS